MREIANNQLGNDYSNKIQYSNRFGAPLLNNNNKKELPSGTVFLWPQCEAQSLRGRLRNRGAVLRAEGEGLLKAEGLVPILLGLGRHSHNSAFMVGVGGEGAAAGVVLVVAVVAAAAAPKYVSYNQFF